MLVIGAVAAVSRDITWKQAALLDRLHRVELVGAAVALLVHRGAHAWRCWLLAAILAVPAVDRATPPAPVRHPGGAHALVLLPTRYDLVGMPGDHVHRAHGVLWLLALGWAMSQARTTRHRLVVSGARAGPGARVLLGRRPRPARRTSPSGCSR